MGSLASTRHLLAAKREVDAPVSATDCDALFGTRSSQSIPLNGRAFPEEMEEELVEIMGGAAENSYYRLIRVLSLVFARPLGPTQACLTRALQFR